MNAKIIDLLQERYYWEAYDGGWEATDEIVSDLSDATGLPASEVRRQCWLWARSFCY